MKTATWFSFVTIVFVTFSVAAQPSPNNAPASGLKITDFHFAAKSSSRLELVELPQNPATRPTAIANYGAEYRSEPTNNSRYFQYEKRRETVRYATMRVTNEGTKAIRSVIWIFTDPHFQGDKEIGYSAVKTKMNIGAGQSAVLVQRVPEHRNCGQSTFVSAGSYVIASSCGRTQRKMTSYYNVEAKLKQIVYTDGAVWNAQ